jgi:hypothetical protein
MTEHIRLNLISQVALTADGRARPIHILRAGTFTGTSGVPVTFEPAHIQGIVQNFQEGKRRKPPITERHDWGRAVGRMLNLYADASGENLYSLPRWTDAGRQLLSEEVYDGFSVELDPAGDGSYVLIGGSLTNYPAVDGLEPVTLSLPPIEAGADTPPLVVASTAPAPSLPLVSKEPPMTDQIQEAPDAAPPPLPPDGALANRQAVYLEQLELRASAREEAAYARATAEFERRIQELEQRRTIESFAHTKTVTGIGHPWAIPCKADELAKLLTETPPAPRAQWMALLNRITAAGLVSFDEIGSSAEGAELADQFNALVAAKVATGMGRVQAIQEVSRQHPDLYAAQTRVKKGGR